MSDAQCGCQCCPNQGKNGGIIPAQFLSIFAGLAGGFPGVVSIFGLWFQFIVFVISVIAVVFHQVLWCVTAPKGVYWALGFLSLFLALSNLGSGIWYFVITYYIEMRYVGRLNGFLWIFSGVLWLIAAILEFMYVCKKDTGEDEKEDEQAVAVAVPAKEDV